jgi:nitrogen fixation protein FixH
MKRGTAWPLAVTTILGLTVAANIWLIRVANGDPSFAIEENYYQRGVQWDDELAQRAHNRALGWRLVATMSPIRQGGGALLQIALTDSAVAPIAGASVVVKAVHIARAGNPMEVTLSSRVPGEYEARMPIERAGLWELRIDVHRGADRFTATERLDVSQSHP